MQALSREDQRPLWRTIRRGEAIRDPLIAAPAIAWVQSGHARCAWGVVFQVVYLGTFVANAALAAAVGEWKVAAIQLVCFDFFFLLTGVGILASRRTTQVVRATLALGHSAHWQAPA